MQGRLDFNSEFVEIAEAQIVELSKRIEFYTTEYSIELLVQKMENGDFFIPAYQREYTWEESRKSRFLESILMGLPIPFLFFWERPDTGKLEVVDGSQRLRTLYEFIKEGFVIGKLSKLDKVSGFAFSDLPKSRQRKIKNRPIRGVILNEHADDEARIDLFDRINTGSKVANNAEIRRGALPGPFTDLIIDLSNDATFRNLAPVPPKQEKEREREELVTRFFAYSDGLEGYHDRVSDFIFSYTKRMNNLMESSELVSEYRKRFKETMKFVETHFPYGFRKSPRSTATPRARFESIAVGVRLALDKYPKIVIDPSKIAGALRSDEFAEITSSDGANVIAKLKGRIDFIQNFLIENQK